MERQFYRILQKFKYLHPHRSLSDKRDMARISTVVSTDWLHKKMQIADTDNACASRDIRVLDATFDRFRVIDTYKDRYLVEHIPNAVFFDLHKCVTSTDAIPRSIPDPEGFTEYVRSLGVWPSTHIIVCDREDLVPAFRTWWLFRLHGHRNISILDGGLKKWISDGYETSTDIPEVESSDFTINIDKSMIRTYEEMKENTDSHAEQIVDSRILTDPKMISSDLDGGVIPNAKHVPYMDMFNEDKTMKSEAELQTLFDEAGVDLSSPAVASCNTGLTACCAAAAAHILGKDIPMYNGSWNEWRRRAPDNLKQRIVNKHNKNVTRE